MYFQSFFVLFGEMGFLETRHLSVGVIVTNASIILLLDVSNAVHDVLCRIWKDVMEGSINQLRKL